MLTSSRFQSGEGPSRSLLRDYEPSDGPFLSTSVYCTEGHKCGIVSQASGSTNPQGSKMKLFATQGNISESQKFGGENLKTLALGELFLCWIKLLFHSL